jgi:hypothetical protein
MNDEELIDLNQHLNEELTRVRGLLQRVRIHYSRDHDDSPPFPYEAVFSMKDWREIEAAIKPSGAESADIGKLDRVDKKIDGRGDDVVIGAESNVADLIAPPLRNERPSTVPENCVGAETGGEKAAPREIALKAADAVIAILATIESPKVDTAHLSRSLIADAVEPFMTRADSREPEKLNNAQKVCKVCGDKQAICDEYGHRNPHNSESSLSSKEKK